MDEIWRPIEGWEELYEISNLGHVLSKRAGRILRPFSGGAGYRQIRLCDDGYQERPYIHQLVAQAFLEPCPPGHEPHHRNFDPADNRAENLQWVPHHVNQLISHDAGRLFGGRERKRKLTPDQVRLVRGPRLWTDQALADQLGVSRLVLWQIRNGLTYRDVE